MGADELEPNGAPPNPVEEAGVLDCANPPKPAAGAGDAELAGVGKGDAGAAAGAPPKTGASNTFLSKGFEERLLDPPKRGAASEGVEVGGVKAAPNGFPVCAGGVSFMAKAEDPVNDLEAASLDVEVPNVNAEVDDGAASLIAGVVIAKGFGASALASAAGASAFFGAVNEEPRTEIGRAHV